MQLFLIDEDVSFRQPSHHGSLDVAEVDVVLKMKDALGFIDC